MLNLEHSQWPPVPLRHKQLTRAQVDIFHLRDCDHLFNYLHINFRKRVHRSESVCLSHSLPLIIWIQPQNQPEDSQVAETHNSGYKPSRRVRASPGGKDSIKGIFDSEEREEYRPSRRVREPPGGKDSISELW
ncbi:hypothetical protein Ac2012v2_001557 [Leucoagaricus gongylophorus]